MTEPPGPGSPRVGSYSTQPTGARPEQRQPLDACENLTKEGPSQVAPRFTVDTYGKWLPMGNRAAVNRLDDESGSKNSDGHSGCVRRARRDWRAVKDSNL